MRKISRGAPFVGACSLLLLLAGCMAEEVKVEKLKRIISEAVSNRRMNETRARVLDSNLDQQDVELLSDEELESSPAILRDYEKAFAREPSSQFTPKVVDPAYPGFTYRHVAISTSFSAPNIEVDLSDPMFPVVRVPEVKGPDGNPAFYFFEFDTTPTFDSPNSWRYPALQVSTDQAGFQNLTGRAGLALDVLRPAQRDEFALSNEVRFPFRATAMRLPDRWSELTYDELERHALGLGYGLSPRDMISEIYRYVRHTYVWGNDTLTRPPLDTFRAGVGECQAINSLMGTMLELNGLRSRIVAGFNPKFRIVSPEGGHSAIEVFDPQTGVWSYVDSYFDLMLLGVSAEHLADGKASAANIGIIEVARADHQVRFGDWITLGKLFKYRVYADTIVRLPNISMLNLRAGPGETEYGLSWTLNIAAPRPLEELFAARKTIYVRARYLVGGSRQMQPLGKSRPARNDTEYPVASPWSVTSFEIAPRLLITANLGAARKPQVRINVCQARKADAIVLAGPFPKELGHAFRSSLPAFPIGDTNEAPKRSKTVLCEDDNPLSPAHAAHDDIRSNGHGHFSHWEKSLYFSTSDNTDPSTNKRTYSVIDLDNAAR
jgi:transglutaminase-like putative cysteine protease